MTASPPSSRFSADARPRRARRWFGRFALAIGVPVVLLAVLETTLRMADFGHAPDFFIRDAEPGIYRTNPQFTELFLPASFGLKPVNFRLTREKSPGVRRVFVIGESAAMGVPEPAFSLAPQLQAQLRAMLPGQQVEVFNLGVTAINSHAIRRIVSQAVEFNPDVLVVYMGNNEVVGPYGPSSVVTGRMPPLWLIRTGIWVRSTRLGQAMQRLIALLRPGAGFTDWRGMEMFAEKTVASDDPRMEGVYSNFADNLDDIIATARGAGVKVVLSTVAVNVVHCAPFASPVRADFDAATRDAWRGAMRQAELAVDFGRPEEARDRLEQSLRIDPGHADTHFRLARQLDALGETGRAQHHYFRALQEDALRFRADARINALIRRAVEPGQSDVVLVDAAEKLGSDEKSIGELAGAKLFFEHVHFRWEGNFALARLIAPSVRAALGGTGAAEGLDARACADAIGYTDLGRLAMLRGMSVLTDRPPFTSQSTYAEDRTRLLAEIASVEHSLAAAEAVRREVGRIERAAQRDPDDPHLLFQLASARVQTGDPAGALSAYERLANRVPDAPELAAQHAFILHALGRSNEAEERLLASAEESPFYFQTYGLLAKGWIAQNRVEEARRYFASLIKRMPSSRPLRSLFAQVLARAGDEAAAAEEWRAVLRLAPDDASALGPLFARLDRAGAREEAVKLLLAAHAYNPRNFDNNSRLVQVFEEKGDAAAAVTYMRALAASGPVNAHLHVALARNLAQLGRTDEMRAALAVARRKAEAGRDESAQREIEALVREDGQ